MMPFTDFFHPQNLIQGRTHIALAVTSPEKSETLPWPFSVFLELDAFRRLRAGTLCRPSFSEDLPDLPSWSDPGVQFWPDVAMCLLSEDTRTSGPEVCGC